MPEIKNLKDAHLEDSDPPFLGSEPPSDAPRGQKPITRQTPPEKQPPSVKYKGEQAKERPEWGEGEAGYKRPKDAADKLRKNMPYKVSGRTPASSTWCPCFVSLRRHSHLGICLLTGIPFDSIASAGVGETFERVYRVLFSSLPVFGVIICLSVRAVNTDYSTYQ